MAEVCFAPGASLPRAGNTAVPCFRELHIPFASPHMPDCCTSPAGASAAASCKKCAKIVEPESNCTTSTKPAKADFWEGSGFF